MRSKTQVVVCAIIENVEGKILLTERHDPTDKQAHGKWEFPGGGVEYGESIEQAVHREIQEEVGLVTDVIKLLPYYHSHIWTGKDKPFHVLLFVFWNRFRSGKIILQNEETSKFVWIDPEKALEYNLLPANKKYIEIFLEEKKHVKKN